MLLQILSLVFCRKFLFLQAGYDCIKAPLPFATRYVISSCSGCNNVAKLQDRFNLLNFMFACCQLCLYIGVDPYYFCFLQHLPSFQPAPLLLSLIFFNLSSVSQRDDRQIDDCKVKFKTFWHTSLDSSLSPLHPIPYHFTNNYKEDGYGEIMHRSLDPELMITDYQLTTYVTTYCFPGFDWIHFDTPFYRLLLLEGFF